jgi:hypothetical protein
VSCGAPIVIVFAAADPKTFKIGENPKKIRL